MAASLKLPQQEMTENYGSPKRYLVLVGGGGGLAGGGGFLPVVGGLSGLA